MISPRTIRIAPLLLAALLAACSDSGVTGPERDAARDEKGGAPTTLRWNGFARVLVTERLTDPPMATRVYTLLSVAQHAAVLAAMGTDERGAPRQVSLRAAVIGASAEVLTRLYPTDAASLAASKAHDHALLRSAGESNVAAGDELGREVARSVVAHAASDGADATWTGTVPTEPGSWYSSASPSRPPLRPMWRHVRTWVMSTGDAFRPPPPPALDSPEFLAALAEVRRISDTRTPAQLQLAHFWADGPNTSTPPGRWNQIAATLIDQYQLSERRATQILAVLNMAMMDAGIACWDSKYEYWLPRPSQMDSEITLPVGLPNFPSYVSGHATFSGAAAEVLAHAFTAESATLRALADDAAMSRVIGGIHYHFDSEEGLKLGRRVASLATPLLREGDLAAKLAAYLP